MIKDLIEFCREHNYEYELCRNWCDCVDYTDFILIKANGKTHTFYLLDNGDYRFDDTIVKSIDELEKLL